MLPRESNNVNLYEVLGVDRVASQDEIKRVYRKLAMQYHPDKNPAGAERFKEVTAAYRILSDKEQRLQYDQNKKKVSLSDLQVELTPAELREFVSDLMRTEAEEGERRRDFERRRQEEMKRRAQFEASHPNFKMSSNCYTIHDSIKRIGSADGNPERQSARAAYEEFKSQGLGSASFFGKSNTSPHSSPVSMDAAKSPAAAPEPSTAHELSRKYGLQGQGTSYKQAMLDSYRTKGAVTPRAKGLASAPFPARPDGVPLADVEVLKESYRRFDYEDVVHREPIRGPRSPKVKEKIADAILSDALTDYDFEDSVTRFARSANSTSG
eukprot:NODE_711_length_1245_cov_82.501789_g672_i0.p1 GENE.NODE_711_length_1245_cov_82.501789_g672_i0~~NODE_711_length_1245_cov_82.501789_g672_i0.p1  ORF type:complete len:324 (+),score=45.16 NODE_711_length_1245_cov_82.501789_g672_i0:236-1207(+)